MSKHKLFVYGILVDRYKSQRPATLYGYRKKLRGHYTIVQDEESKVESYVIEITDEEFQKIDRIESYPTYYDRFQVEIETEKGFEKAWVYQMKKEEK